MNMNELKAELIAAGAKEEDLAKVDFANIEHIIDGANDIEGLCKALKEAYPTFDEAAFKQVIAEQTKKTDDAQELSDDDLEAVAGGSVGSWLNKNKEWLIPVATVAVLGIGYSLFRYFKGSGNTANKRTAKAIDNEDTRTGSFSNITHKKLEFNFDAKLFRCPSQGGGITI